MDEWFGLIAAGGELSSAAAKERDEACFVVIPGPLSPDGLAQLARAYDAAMACASPDDLSVGRTTTRIHDFVNRGQEFQATGQQQEN